MSAKLPSLPMVECRECVDTFFTPACPHCDGSGKVTVNPPDKCPWCGARRKREGTIGWGWYDCGASGSVGVCPRVPSDIAAVIADLCADQGVDLYDALVGVECEDCMGTGYRDPYQSVVIGRLPDCQQCNGSGRLSHPDVPEVFAMLKPHRQKEVLE